MQDQGKIKKTDPDKRYSRVLSAHWPAIKCRTRLERTLGK